MVRHVPSLALLGVAAALTAAACGGGTKATKAAESTSAATAKAPVGCAVEADNQVRKTAGYVFALHVGGAERMWTMAQAKARHPKGGEVMVGGAMSSPMSMGGSARHVEVQICKRPGNVIMTHAHPSISLSDQTAHGMAMHVPVAVMEGLDEGVADLHYGNNVSMMAGHRYSVVVALHGEHAAFMVRAPKTTGMK